MANLGVAQKKEHPEPKACSNCKFMSARGNGADSTIARYHAPRSREKGEHSPTLECPGFMPFNDMSQEDVPRDHYREAMYALLLAEKTAHWLTFMEQSLEIWRDKEKHKLAAWEFALMEATDLAWNMLSRLKVHVDVCGAPHESEGL